MLYAKKHVKNLEEKHEENELIHFMIDDVNKAIDFKEAIF